MNIQPGKACRLLDLDLGEEKVKKRGVGFSYNMSKRQIVEATSKPPRSLLGTPKRAEKVYWVGQGSSRALTRAFKCLQLQHPPSRSGQEPDF